MRLRKRARMMQPPRHSEAISPNLQMPAVLRRRGAELLEPLRVGDDLRGVERVAEGVDLRFDPVRALTAAGP